MKLLRKNVQHANPGPNQRAFKCHRILEHTLRSAPRLAHTSRARWMIVRHQWLIDRQMTGQSMKQMHYVRDPQLRNKILSHPGICYNLARSWRRLCRYLSCFKVAAVGRCSIKTMLTITAIDLCNLYTQPSLFHKNTDIITGRAYNKVFSMLCRGSFCCPPKL
jgi:hypothetical protein